MKQTITGAHLQTDRLVPGGQALATLDSGKKAFLWGALPREIVRSFTITKNKSHYLEGIATELAEPLSPHRVPPRDDCYLATSPWQIFDYDYELEQKAALVRECFRQNQIELPDNSTRHQIESSNDSPQNPKPHPTISHHSQPQTPPTLKIITDGQEYFYRNKMEYSLYWDKTTQQIQLAFHLRGTHQKLPITQSSLEKPEIFARAQAIVNQLNAERAEARQFQSLVLRASQDGTVSGGLLVKGQPHPQFPILTDRIAGRTFHYSPNGFFQVNLPVYELALAAIGAHIQTKKVLDLYAGVGTIGLTVASDRELTLVESDAAAYRELEKNCSGGACNGIVRGRSSRPSLRGSSLGPRRNCGSPRTTPLQPPYPIFAKSESALDFITPDTTVILDPPRAGCDPKLIAKLSEQTPPTIIYLSCNPITQARDIARLIPKYKIAEHVAFNFFPRTPHIENLVILQASGH